MKNTMSNAAPSPPRAQSSDSTRRFESAESLLSSESSESSQSSLGAAAAADAPVAEAAAATVDNHSPGGTAPIPEAPQVLTPPGTNRTDHLRADEESAYCPYFQHVVELLGRRWTSSIVMHLTKGPARFSDIAGAIPGLSDRLLTERLHELEAEKLVERAWKNTCTYYQFSDLGKELLPSIEALKEFSHKAAPTIVFSERPGRRI